MAYIGRGLQLGQHIKQTITTANGVLTAFAMDLNATQNSLLVVYGNVIQEPGVAYTVTSAVITFTSAPVTGNSLYIIYLGQELTSVSNPTTAEVNTLIAGSGHTTATAASSEAAADAASKAPWASTAAACAASCAAIAKFTLAAASS